jgi:glycosyltransferase involved in cell wall biosynthesis
VKRAAVFLQRRGHRAGAQTCLLRLLRQRELSDLNPVVVTGEEAWLSRECAREGIECLVEPFPSSRSLKGRLFGNSAFSSRVQERLHEKTISFIHGNDHLESLLTLALGKRLGVPTALFLRSPTMTREDFRKYDCGAHALVAAVGEDLQAAARGWSPGTAIELIHDGLEPGEFLAPKPVPAAFPRRVLVIGSDLDWKGWGDAVVVLSRLKDLQASFTGKKPEGIPENPNFQFLGRVEGFRDLVREFDLVFNPSWHESFGMAALEVLAAGVPLFSTRCGVVPRAVEDPRWLAQPRAIGEMETKLKAIAAGWPASALDVAGAQRRIRQHFLIDASAKRLLAAYKAKAIL